VTARRGMAAVVLGRPSLPNRPWLASGVVALPLCRALKAASVVVSPPARS